MGLINRVTNKILSAKKEAKTASEIVLWSGQWESNPPLWLGKHTQGFYAPFYV